MFHGFEPENAKRGGVFKIYVEEKAPNEGCVEDI